MLLLLVLMNMQNRKHTNLFLGSQSILQKHYKTWSRLQQVLKLYTSLNPDEKDGKEHNFLAYIYFMLKKHCMFLRLFPSINPNFIGGKGRKPLLNLLLTVIDSRNWKQRKHMVNLKLSTEAETKLGINQTVTFSIN